MNPKYPQILVDEWRLTREVDTSLVILVETAMRILSIPADEINQEVESAQSESAYSGKFSEIVKRWITVE